MQATENPENLAKAKATATAALAFALVLALAWMVRSGSLHFLWLAFRPAINGKSTPRERPEGHAIKTGTQMQWTSAPDGDLSVTLLLEVINGGLHANLSC